MENRRDKSRLNFRSEVRELCSISSAGVVLLCKHRMPLSSELSFSMETEVFGLHQEWTVKGWVVDCEAAQVGMVRAYKVTLLFHDLPEGLEQVLAMSRSELAPYPPVPECPMYGLN